VLGPSAPAAAVVVPTSGPTSGGTSTVVSAGNLFPANNVTCVFGNVSTAGRLKVAEGQPATDAAGLAAALRIECATPPAAAGDVQLQVRIL
jgi:hypothetical protein